MRNAPVTGLRLAAQGFGHGGDWAPTSSSRTKVERLAQN